MNTLTSALSKLKDKLAAIKNEYNLDASKYRDIFKIDPIVIDNELVYDVYCSSYTGYTLVATTRCIKTDSFVGTCLLHCSLKEYQHQRDIFNSMGYGLTMYIIHGIKGSDKSRSYEIIFSSTCRHITHPNSLSFTSNPDRDSVLSLNFLCQQDGNKKTLSRIYSFPSTVTTKLNQKQLEFLAMESNSWKELLSNIQAFLVSGDSSISSGQVGYHDDYLIEGMYLPNQTIKDYQNDTFPLTQEQFEMYKTIAILSS